MKALSRISVVSIVALCVMGCAAPLNQYNASRYFELGLENEFAGNYEAARESFHRAFVNAELGGASPEYLSAIIYNLGRMHGYTCNFDLAEKLLVDALVAERALDEPGAANITKRLAELARLSFDMGNFEQSARYYSEAIPLLEQLAIRDTDPVGYAYFLESSAEAHRRSGKADIGSQQKRAAAVLRTEHEGVEASFIPVEYHDVCNGESAL